MMAGSIETTLKQTNEGTLVWNQEEVIFSITEMICEIMERDAVPRIDLARRLKKTKGYITQLLDGSTNMTARTISDVFTVLGYKFVPSCYKVETDVQTQPTTIGQLEWNREFTWPQGVESGAVSATS